MTSLGNESLSTATQSVFGIRADGHEIQLGYLSASAAETIARDLFGEGYAVIEIVDHSKGIVVKSLYPATGGPPSL